MKLRYVVAAFAALSAAGAAHSAAPSLEEGFLNPPNSAKPHTWYHMMNGNVTKEGITCDFEALAKAGIGGVQMFDAGCDIPPGGLDFNSPEWFDMFKHAASEARRLGLEICIPNCSGWSSSGGPWNMPSNGMKRLVFTETAVKGPTAFKGKLPRTKNDNGFYEDIAVVAFRTPSAELSASSGVKSSCDGLTARADADAPFTAEGVSFRFEGGGWSADAEVTISASDDGQSFAQVDKYTDSVVKSGAMDRTLRYHRFAKPVKARAFKIEVKTNAKVTLKDFQPERRVRLSSVGAKTFEIRGVFERDEIPASAEQVVGDVVELTDRLAADGTLEWNAPAGEWKVLRFGYICNGRKNHPASKYGVGLEVDKLSASAMDYHFDQYVTRLCNHLGKLAGDVKSGFNSILVDSYEVGSQNWTQGFEKEFQKRMGYSPIPYLPVFTGRVVGSVERSERFLEDFRRVVADLFAENYSGHLAKLCHDHGLKLYLEPYGNCPSDNLQYGEAVDVPMGEFWSNAASGDHCTGVGNAKYVSYLSHVWGRRYVATESFTANPSNGGRWQTTPFSIKAQGDRAYAKGVNRVIYHRFTHQPWPGSQYLPGMTMGKWGMHLDRTQTWWPFAGEWFRYQTRCQWMLQEGTFVADALLFCGEEVPNQGGNTDGAGASALKLPDGYDWDVCASKAMYALKVVNGRVVVPGGVSYALLILPLTDTMSEKMLANVARLLDAGAKVCFTQKPVRAPGLVGYPKADGRVKALVDKIWAKGVMQCDGAEALKRLGIAPDVVVSEDVSKQGFASIHRRGNGADWYFVALNNVARKTFEVSFRQTGRQPEIWDAEKGTVRDAEEWREENGRTIVSFDFQPSGSAFVVFRRAAKAKSAKAPKRPEPIPSGSVEGPWQVSFPTDWYSGGTAVKSVTWDALADWKDVNDDDIRYFSGTATYKKRVSFTPKAGARTVLDLGKVKNFAEVKVNGKSFPVLWRPPYQVDITDALDAKSGAFSLEVKVTNLWPNRLIGDDILYPDDCEWKGSGREIAIVKIPDWVKEGKRSPTGRHTFTTWKHWTKENKLLPSGLLGPVSLLAKPAAN